MQWKIYSSTHKFIVKVLLEEKTLCSENMLLKTNVFRINEQITIRNT